MKNDEILVKEKDIWRVVITGGCFGLIIGMMAGFLITKI